MNTDRRCQTCQRDLRYKNRQARYCSTPCRVTAHRAARRRAIPAELTSRARWVRWTARCRNGQRTTLPLTLDRQAASVLDPATWADYAAAAASPVGDGLGFILNGDGLACLVLADCLVDGQPTPAAQAVLDRFPRAWVEVSPTGEGLRVWGRAKSQPVRRATIDGLSVELLTRDRWLAVTGYTFRCGALVDRL